MSKHTDEFLDFIRQSIIFWDHQKDRSSKEKLEGLSHTILAMLDGVSGSFKGDITSLEKAWDGYIHDDFYKEKENV